MRSLSAFLLALVALGGLLALSHPTTDFPSDLTVRTDGDVSTLRARGPVYLPAEAELELRELKESYELVKRDSLDARNPVLIRLVAQAVVTIVRGIIQAVAEDKLARAEFTANFIQSAMDNYPQFNWVICHVDHVTLFDGAKDEDWGHGHEEFDITIGGTIGYEIYWFGSGTFVRLGDGGFLNWSYGGNILSRTDSEDSQRATVIFGSRA